MVVTRLTTSPQDELFTKSPPFLSDIIFISQKHSFTILYIIYLPLTDVSIKKMKKEKVF